MRKIVISDIHGCAATFQRLLVEKVELTKKDHLFLLGDYIDRGPDSKGVIDLIFSLIDSGQNITCLLGNHEEMLLQSINNGNWFSSWLFNGGHATMKSFGTDFPDELPKKYLKFFKSLKHYHEVDNFILVHAGLNFRDENPFSNKNDMLWIRNWYNNIDKKWLKDRKVIHGHTTTEMREIIHNWNQFDLFQVLDIDAGCYKINNPDKGHLCAYDMTRDVLYFQKNIDMFDD